MRNSSVSKHYFWNRTKVKNEIGFGENRTRRRDNLTGGFQLHGREHYRAANEKTRRTKYRSTEDEIGERNVELLRRNRRDETNK